MANRTVTAELEMKGKDATGPAFKSITARMGQMEKQFARFNRTAEQFNSKIKNIERSTGAFARVNKGVEASSAMLMTSLKGLGAYAVGTGIKRSIQSFAEMERHMTRIGITADASKSEISGATKEVEKLSMSLGYGTFDPAISALDTLVSSGMDLKQAMAFLPSVMATAQASGAETEDIANAGLKTASAFKLTAADMQKAFDDMAYSGKQGQFELKDMARFIPSLSSSFSALGYTGEEGLKQLLAILQTVRAQTGTAEEAATNAQNIFGKVYSQETVKNFSKFGIDLDKQLKNAKKNGEDLMHAFVRLAKEAVKGDLSKLPQLFNDQQVRLGMLALINGTEEWAKQLEALNNVRVSGTVFRDVNTVLEDTQAKLDRLQLSWDRFVKQIGSAASGPVGTVLDLMSSTMEREDAINAGIKKSGMTPDDILKYNIARGQGGSAETAKLDRYFAFLGDPTNRVFRDAYMADFADTPQMQKMKGRGQGYFIEGPPVDHGYTPNNLPKTGPYPLPGAGARDQYFGEIYGNMGGRVSPPATTDFTSTVGAPGSVNVDWNRFFFGDMANGGSLIDHMKMDLSGAGEEAGQALGQAASEKINADAVSAGQSFGEAAGTAMLSILKSWAPSVGSGMPGTSGVNANVGRPGAVTPPATFGPR